MLDFCLNESVKWGKSVTKILFQIMMNEVLKSCAKYKSSYVKKLTDACKTIEIRTGG